MTKIDIHKPKMGDIRFPITLTNAPTKGYVVNARAANLYKDGEVVEGKLSKINIDVVNYDVAKTVTEHGGSLSDLAVITVEYIADNDALQKVNLEALMGKVLDLSKADAALKWVSRGSGGGWNGIKIVLSELSVLSSTRKGNVND